MTFLAFMAVSSLLLAIWACAVIPNIDHDQARVPKPLRTARPEPMPPPQPLLPRRREGECKTTNRKDI